MTCLCSKGHGRRTPVYDTRAQPLNGPFVASHVTSRAQTAKAHRCKSRLHHVFHCFKMTKLGCQRAYSDLTNIIVQVKRVNAMTTQEYRISELVSKCPVHRNPVSFSIYYYAIIVIVIVLTSDIRRPTMDQIVGKR